MCCIYNFVQYIYMFFLALSLGKWTFGMLVYMLFAYANMKRSTTLELVLAVTSCQVIDEHLAMTSPHISQLHICVISPVRGW